MAQFNRLAVAIDLSITDRPGIAVAYDYRARRAIQKIENPRSAKTDYFERRSDINKDVRAGAIRDFEAKTDAVRKERENGKAGKDKENEKETQRKPVGGKISKRAAVGSASWWPMIWQSSGRINSVTRPTQARTTIRRKRTAWGEDGAKSEQGGSKTDF